LVARLPVLFAHLPINREFSISIRLPSSTAVGGSKAEMGGGILALHLDTLLKRRDGLFISFCGHEGRSQCHVRIRKGWIHFNYALKVAYRFIPFLLMTGQLTK